ncbi:glycosyl hydrolase [Sphaerisporangium album]|uniref:Glycosyl hydrolase n=1 Tax=Sphaerisporangium album TaxID=509200 RepID=A0A367FPH4_9ACTN|nr:sigma-70 family RNA polymerase sigma factor [Sphaerisporangium album]RCG31799.1 glycosyl hydrolase [Sphaerisporangium album]
MPGTGRGGPDTSMVAAARDGDQRALDALVAESLPLLYNIVGRALNGHNDVDDVVQETLLRVVRGLPDLRDLGAYRSWMVAIAVRQVRDHQQDRSNLHNRRTDLDTAREIPDPASDFAAVTILRLGLTDQRREVAEATRWLDGDDRSLLALWWLEETGELGRSDLAGALGLSGRHAAVRVQRMKEQVQTARMVVRALNADPRCPELRTLTWNWDGVPSALWRKRFARHVRGCAVCGRRAAGLLPIDRLLGGLPLLPIPAGFLLDKLHATLTAADAAGRAASHLPLGWGGASPGAHALHARPRGLLSSIPHGPVAGTVAGLAVVVGGVLITRHVTIPPPAPAPRATIALSATPSPSASPSPSPSPSATPTRKATPRATRPPVVAASVKKGVAAWRAAGGSAALAKSGASWYYTWSTGNEGVSAPKAKFVPMIWGASSVTAAKLAEARRAGPYLLGFNEPDMPGQADMTVEQALDLWPKLMSAGRVLGSPSVAFGAATPGSWFDRFMTGAAERGHRVDFIALHWYGGDFRTAAAVSQLRSYIQSVYKRYRKPIWLTEYALIDFSNGARYASDAQQAAFVTASTRMLTTLPYVKRYAWFGLSASARKPGSGLFHENGTPTKAGRAFQSAR